MRRCLTATTVVALVLGSALPVSADWWPSKKSSFCCNYEQNKIWPLPYVYPDRAAAAAPFQIMINKGWQRQNTLGHYHFDEANRLTEAGRLKVQWILTDPALERRQVFVHAARTSEDTAVRIASVQDFLAVTRDGQEAAVAESNLAAPSYPADYVDEIGRKFRESIPLPRLPERRRLEVD